MTDKRNNSQEPGGPGRGPGGPPAAPPSRSIMVWVLFIGLAVTLIFMVMHGAKGPAREITANEFFQSLDAGNVSEVTVGDTTVSGKLRSTEGLPANAPVDFEFAYPKENHERLEQILSAHKELTWKYSQENGLFTQLLISWLPWIVMLAILWFVVIRVMRGAAGGGGVLGNFGRSRHRMSNKEHTNITFEDVAGVEEAKEEVTEIIAFLKNPKKFQRLGGRIPRGVLLVGSPGTGKTLLAKAIAGEADVPFFSISGSDFVEMFVGVGASRVRDLFKQAKDNSPCIIFLDEIDAVGRRRTYDPHGGSQETSQTLNAILVEMDGFDTSDQVIVIAATNRSDVLDPALTRPGRFDRQIQVPLPDIEGRMAILKVHARKVKMNAHVDLHALARGTPMFSGADLAAIINEAAIAATMADKDSIEQTDLEEARDKVRWGRASRSRVIDEEEKEATAYHEAGHALATLLIKDAEPLHKVSIIPRGPALGATFSLPEKDRHTYTRRRAVADLQVLFAGRIAEQMFCDDLSSGASNDIERATMLARVMVCDWGMSPTLGPIRYARPEDGAGFEALAGKEYSDKTAEVIDSEVKAILSDAYDKVEKLLADNRSQVEAIAKALLKYETLSADDVRKLADGKKLDRPTVGDLLEAEQGRGKPASSPKPDTSLDIGGNLGSGPLPQPG
ncbi:MAG: ATP-dependent zinc metalloprotease FtsH [Phycisphaerae bacterium]|nr:ATP-dependent zinc metalloprotease FtsH [Phycisphaerae bacterium]